MPRRKSSRNHRGSRNHCEHNAKYWARLAREFKTLTYQRCGAYNTIGKDYGDSDNAEVDERQRDYFEQRKESVGDRVRRRQRQESRLEKVLDYARPKAPLDKSS